MTIIWFTERKSIMMELFFKKLENPIKKYLNISDKYDYNIKNFNNWKYNDIIDIDQFELYEFVDNKDKLWYDKINSQTPKPKLIIINRTFLTLNNKYNLIINNKPVLIIHDECHSAINKTTTKFYLYAKSTWKSTFIGFSATPLKTGKTNKKNNYELLNELYNNPIDNSLNILANYNINRAISNTIIIKPKFIINKLTKRINKKDITQNQNDISIIMETLNNAFGILPYGKMLAWCGGIRLSGDCRSIFNKYKIDLNIDGSYKYPNLYNVNEYIDNSTTNDESYLDFYKLYTNNNQHNQKGILFCAEKHREGSDIPFLDSCIFLDGCINRTSHVFIQCVGRVLRKDKYNLKNNGLIIDFISNEVKSNEQIIANKLILYYIELENIGLNDKTKINQYIEMSNRIDISRCKETNIIKIKCDNYNIEFVCDILNWDHFGDIFDELLCKTLNIAIKDKFIAIKQKIKLLDIFDASEYREKYNNNLFGLPIDPKYEFKQYWISWIDYLGMDTTLYFTFDEWIKYISESNINNITTYKIIAKQDKRLPSMPEEFYKNDNFGSLQQRLEITHDNEIY